MKASLYLEAAQCPRLCLLSRPRSRGHMPRLVGDHGQVLRVLGWALTRISNLSLGWALLTRVRNLSLVLQSDSQGADWWLCVEQSRELFSNIRGRGGASNACFHS